MTDTLIILAGGASSRMKNSIDSNLSSEKSAQANKRCKGLIEFNGRPFLSYLLDNVLKAGFKNVIITTGENSDLFRSTYDKNKEFVNLNIKFATQYIPKERVKPLGTADAVYQSIMQYPELKNKKFCVCNSDNLYSSEVFRLLRESNYEQALIAYDRDKLLYPKERISRFAIMDFTKNYQLHKIIEKPEQGKISKYKDEKNKVRISMNIFLFDGNIFFKYLKECPIHVDRDEKELPTAIMNMISDNHKIFGITASENVLDLTSKEDILKLETVLK
tara:strand:+ start:2067 stop:2891 length:825 start_codon:yes stop_codon:yes gene_type:complete